MRYVSTRGGSDDRGFANVLIEGMAPDGGLFVPDETPALSQLPDTFAGAVAAICRPFIAPDPLADELEDLAAEAYSSFRHPEVAPLCPVGDNRYLLELFWGPTLSFKDYALQLLGAMFDRVLQRSDRRLLVLGATSGDTGSAAIEACRGRDGIDIVILFPDGGVSEVQRRQMTTVPDENVHSVAVEGSFDDCQRLVKQAFATLSERHPLGAFNSINWGRVMAQTAYYAYAASRLGPGTSFVVPTGNFGNILSAHIARRMGAPIAGLTVANNANHGLADLIENGSMSVSGVSATVAPAMDVQIPSNLERWLYEALDGDGSQVRQLQSTLAAEGRLDLPDWLLDRLQGAFAAGWCPDTSVVDTIRRVHEQRGVVLDPHTAVAWKVAEDSPTPDAPQVIVATADPAKFPDTVAEAIGVAPALPEHLADLLERPERARRIPAEIAAVADVLESVGD